MYKRTPTQKSTQKHVAYIACQPKQTCPLKIGNFFSCRRHSQLRSLNGSRDAPLDGHSPTVALVETPLQREGCLNSKCLKPLGDGGWKNQFFMKKTKREKNEIKL